MHFLHHSTSQHICKTELHMSASPISTINKQAWFMWTPRFLAKTKVWELCIPILQALCFTNKKSQGPERWCDLCNVLGSLAELDCTQRLPVFPFPTIGSLSRTGKICPNPCVFIYEFTVVAIHRRCHTTKSTQERWDPVAEAQTGPAWPIVVVQ